MISNQNLVKNNRESTKKRYAWVSFETDRVIEHECNLKNTLHSETSRPMILTKLTTGNPGVILMTPVGSRRE